MNWLICLERLSATHEYRHGSPPPSSSAKPRVMPGHGSTVGRGSMHHARGLLDGLSPREERLAFLVSRGRPVQARFVRHDDVPLGGQLLR